MLWLGGQDPGQDGRTETGAVDNSEEPVKCCSNFDVGNPAHQRVPNAEVEDRLIGGHRTTTFAFRHVSVKTVSTYHRSFMVVPHPDIPSMTGSPGVWSEQWTVERYIREPYLGIPWPQLNLRIDLPKIIDLVALSSRQRSKLMKTLATRR